MEGYLCQTDIAAGQSGWSTHCSKYCLCLENPLLQNVITAIPARTEPVFITQLSLLSMLTTF